jgi:hypothetical protein
VKYNTRRALVNTVMNLRVPWNGKFLSSCATGGFSRRAQLHGVSTTPAEYIYLWDLRFHSGNYEYHYLIRSDTV